MISILEETPTGMQKEGQPLCRRLYLAGDKRDHLPTDAAPGSLALVRSDNGVCVKILFPDGLWEEL